MLLQYFACFALLIISILPVTAQESDAKSCARITNDATRLECYDLIFKKTSTQVTPTRGNWEVTQEQSKIDDTSNVVLRLKSVEPIRNRYGRTEYLDLIITCRDQRTMLYIVFGGHFMSSLNSGTVTYRIDKTPAQKRQFRESNDHQALGLWSASEAIPFIRSLYGAKILFVRATPHSESSVSAEFNVTGIEEAVVPLGKACKWNSSRKPEQKN